MQPKRKQTITKTRKNENTLRQAQDRRKRNIFIPSGIGDLVPLCDAKLSVGAALLGFDDLNDFYEFYNFNDLVLCFEHL
jgi:hypothetical protein